MANRETWDFARRLSRKKYHVFKEKTNVLDIIRSELVIEDRLYGLTFVSHFLRFANYVSSITFMNKKTFSISFIQLFMSIRQNCTAITPAEKMNLFNIAIEDAGNKQISIKPNLDNDHMSNLIKTPEEV